MSPNARLSVGRWVCQRTPVFPIVTLILLLACRTLAAGGETPLSAQTAEYRTDQILIQPKAGITSDSLAQFHAAHRAGVLHTFRRFHGVQVLKVPQGETVQGLISKYQKSGLIEFAEPDYIVHAAAAPNDPLYQDGTLWWLNNTGQDGGTPHADIDALDAWNVMTSASNVVVAVLDTGVRYTHEDLASNIWVNPIDGSHGFNAFTGTNNIDDDNGHGTLVCGMLGAVGNNGKGTVGAAWTVQMMICKCLDANLEGSDSTVLACLDFAETNGARVMNCSFGTTGTSEAVSNAIVAAQQAGIIVVAACGDGNKVTPQINVDILPFYPACYPLDNIISVAGTTRNDTLGAFSNFGAKTVDLGAPGDQISSTYTNSDSGYAISTPSSGISGTSFAAPLVSATVAMVMAKYPDENYQQIIARILKGTDPIPALAGKCVTGGRLNLYKALSPPIDLTVVPGANGSPFQLIVSTGPNRICVVQSSPDLTNWFPVFTNTTDTNGIFSFVDENSTNFPQLFYRAVSTP